jgi:hypothetical protein
LKEKQEEILAEAAKQILTEFCRPGSTPCATVKSVFGMRSFRNKKNQLCHQE